jgi:hypothetical protein
VPWERLTIDDFDRMSILLSELAKCEHSIAADAVGERNGQTLRTELQ